MPVYTKPEHVFSVDEMANATLLNQHHRDNMAATLHRVAYKTADESVVNSTGLQVDDHLTFAAGNSLVTKLWYLRLVLWCSQPTVSSLACNIDVAFGFSGALNLSSWTLGTAGGGQFSQWSSGGVLRALDAVSGSATERTVHVIEGIHASNPGSTFTVSWAQDTADLGALYVYKGSTLWAADLT